MKRINIFYWIFTGIFAAFMLFTAIPDVILQPEAVKFITALGYPVYFVHFIGVAKVLGAIAILIPNWNRLKEWAYAGLFFDLIGAWYSIYMKEGTFKPEMLFMVLPLTFLFLSYYFWHKKAKVVGE